MKIKIFMNDLNKLDQTKKFIFSDNANEDDKSKNFSISEQSNIEKEADKIMNFLN